MNRKIKIARNIFGALPAALGIIFMIIPFLTEAQQITNEGATITIKPGSKIYLGTYKHIDGIVDNSGEIHISDSLVNNHASSGIFGDDGNPPTEGSVIFKGGNPQQISGTGMSVYFYNFNLDNTSGTPFKLFRPFNVNGMLTFSTGNINLNGRVIDLGTYGSLQDEQNNKRIFGTSGYITATNNLSFGFSGEVGNLGLSLNIGDNNFGFTEIRRSHFQLSPFSPNGHINRFFEFRPQNSATDPVPAMGVEFFDEETLPAHNISEYRIFHSNTDGFSWIKLPSPEGDDPEFDFQVEASNISGIAASAEKKSIITVSESNCINGPVVDLGPASRNICEGASFELGEAPGQQVYIWKKDGNEISGASTHKLTVTEAGLYELTVIDGNGCEGSDNITIFVREKPVADFEVTNFACEGTATLFNDLSSSADGTITYSWNFGDPSTTSDVSADAEPSYIYSNDGAFNVSLTVTSQYGCVSDPQTHIAVVNPLPVVDFSSNQVCKGEATTFTNNAVVSGLNYVWDFGNGNTSTASSTAQFTFLASGNHSVTLRATNPNTTCTQSLTKTVVINPVPIADFSFVGQCKPNEILFENTSVITNGTMSYEWDFGDGEISSSEDPFKVFTTEGTFDVTLTVTSDLGCTNVITKSVNISLQPSIFTGDVETCGEQIVLDADPNNIFAGATFEWSDQSTQQVNTITKSGVYTVTVTMPGGCKTTESVKVTLNTILTPDLDPVVEACGQYVADAGFYPSGIYEWSTGASGQTITITQSGTYSVHVTDQNGCEASASVAVTINALPVVSLGDDRIICNGTTTTLNAGNAGSDFKWSDGSFAQTLVVGASNVYSVTVTNEHGCSSQDEVRVTVLDPFTVDLGPDRTICGGVSLELNAGITGVTYLWGSSNNDTGSSQTFSAERGGKYWVRVTNDYNCVASDTIMINETENTLNAEFTSASQIYPGDTLHFVNVSYPVPFESSWNFGNGQTSTVEDPDVIYYTEGTFSVTLTVTNGLCTDSKTKTITVLKDEGEQSGGRIVRPDDILSTVIFPNPARSYVNVDVLLSSVMIVRVQLVNTLGVSFYDESFHGERIEEKIGIDALNAGVYFIKVFTDRQVRTIRLLKH